MRRDRTFQLVPGTCLATVPALPGAQGKSLGSPGCARGADLLWIFRCGGAWREREAEGAADTHPPGWRGGEDRGRRGRYPCRLPQPLTPMRPQCSGVAVLACKLVWQLLLSH